MRDLRRVAMALLGLFGLGIASYLTYVHYRGLSVTCPVGGGHSCETVQKSSYAKLAGVPVPLIGIVGYVTILASLAFRGELARTATLTATLIGFGFSVYLTYREVFTIDAICQWCVGSAIVMTLLFALAIWRFLAPPPGEL